MIQSNICVGVLIGTPAPGVTVLCCPPYGEKYHHVIAFTTRRATRCARTCSVAHQINIIKRVYSTRRFHILISWASCCQSSLHYVYLWSHVYLQFNSPTYILPAPLQPSMTFKSNSGRSGPGGECIYALAARCFKLENIALCISRSQANLPSCPLQKSIFYPDCSQNHKEVFNLCAACCQGGPTSLYEFTLEFGFRRLSEDASKCYRLGNLLSFDKFNGRRSRSNFR
jgi:hypothetical protein